MENTTPIDGSTGHSIIDANCNEKLKKPSKLNIIFPPEVLQSFRDTAKIIHTYKVVENPKTEDLTSLGVEITVDENFNIIDIEAFRRDQRENNEATKVDVKTKENVSNVEIQTPSNDFSSNEDRQSDH